jgi:hypothetical protein
MLIYSQNSGNFMSQDGVAQTGTTNMFQGDLSNVPTPDRSYHLTSANKIFEFHPVPADKHFELCNQVYNRVDFAIEYPYTITTKWLDDVTDKMFTAADLEPDQLIRRINMYCAMWSGDKLKVLSAMDITPTWWWIREGLCTIMVHKGLVVDDSPMMQQWVSYEKAVKQNMHRLLTGNVANKIALAGE